MFKNFFIIFIISLLLSSHAFPKEILNILSNAFNNNPKLNAERANLKASKQDLNISRGEFLPSITISGDVATQKDKNRTDYAGSSLQDTRAEPTSQSLIIKQKIFDGFTNYNDVKKSKLELDYSQIKLDKLEQETLLEAAKAFYGLGFNYKNLEFNQSNLDLLERQVETDRSRLDRGEIGLTDLAQSESSLAGANAKLIRAENELISGKKNFQKIIGTTAPDEVDLDFIPEFNLPSSADHAIIIAQQKNTDLSLAKIDLEVAKKDVLIAKGEIAPSASLSYSLKKNEGLSSSVDEREQEEVKATVTWPIFDGGKNLSSVKKAKFKFQQKQLILDDVKKNMNTEIANAWTTYSSSKGVLDATLSQLKAAEIANEGITLEYDTGNKRTTLEVIQSRTLLLEARTSYVKAQRDFAIAQFNLLASIGDLYLSNIK